MREGVIPAQLHFEEPNPRLDWANLPLSVVSEPAPWEAGERPRRAGVSSFGYSGTNAHVVFEAWDQEQERRQSSRWGPSDRHRPPPAGETPFAQRRHRVFPLSGKTPGALSALAERCRKWLAKSDRDSETLADAAWTAGVGRDHFPCRAGLAFSDTAELRERLEALAASPEDRDTGEPSGGKIGFLYTGQGSQWPGMGRELYEREPAFREVLDRCDAVFREERDESLFPVLFGDEGKDALDRTEWTQPALYALQSGLTALWASVGVRPEAVLGHSVGEVAAAAAAGVFDLEAGMRFATRRGALMGSLPRRGKRAGGMLAVFAPEDAVAALLAEPGASSRGAKLELAADNGAHQVVTGPLGLLRRFEARLAEEGLRAVRLRTSHAFHSALMDPVLDELEAAVGDVSAPSLPLAAGLSGALLEEVPDGAWWRRQAREPVRFAAAVATLAELGVGVLVEIGPHTVLGPMAALAWPGTASPAPVASLRKGGSGDFAAAVAQVYEAGVDVSFEGLFAGERRRRVSLPTVPFQRERYWVEPPGRRPSEAGHPLLGKRLDLRRGETAFETELGAGDPDWLADHRVFGVVVAPGALYAAQVLAALGELGRGSSASLTEVQFRRPLVLAEGGHSVQVLLDPEGRFEVASRTAGAEWELHAEGGVGPGVAEAARVALDALREGLSPLPAADVYARLAEGGIVHGPAFRVLGEVWAGPGTALAEVALPAGLVEPAGPTVRLDGAFQALYAVSEFGDRDEGAWLPFGWERLWLAGPLPDRFWCRVEAGDGSEDTREAELAFYTPAGEALGGVRGLTLRRASRSTLLGSRVEELLHEVVWRTGPPVGLQPADFLVGPGELVSGLPDAERYLEEEGLVRERRLTQSAALEREARWYALHGLEELGWERRAGDEFETDALRRRLRVTGDHRRLFGRLLDILDGAGLVSPDGAGGWMVTVGTGDPLPEALAAPEDPPGSIETALLRRCGGSLAEVLRGRENALGLLFGEEPGAAAFYRDSGRGRALNRTLADAVRTAAAPLPEGRPLRVLEVGAGTGATTAAVLDSLPAGRVDYDFTDISAGFLAEAERRFGESGNSIRYRVLDIECDPREQGFEGHAYDLVIAANVLHATRDLGATLARCRRLLAPSGLLVALEETAPAAWLDLTFGLLPGWWRFEDRYRQNCALVPIPVWRQALADAGFPEVEFAAAEGGPAVVLARGPSETALAPGLFVLAGTGRVAEELADELRNRGQTPVSGPVNGDRQAWRSCFASLPGETPFRGVVHLAGVRGEEAAPPAAELREDLETVGASALAMTQGMSDAGVHPSGGTWFVTRGGQVVGRETSGLLAGAALWGLGSVVELEHPDLHVRLLDLDPESAPSVSLLANELAFPDRETRVAWRDGQRRTPRLVRLAPGTAPEGGNWRFAPDPGGDFDRLPVERLPDTTPGSGEVRVAVEAAGLNFHDVLVAMGVVDPGAALGGEFCGRVLEAGPGMSGIAVGDRVLGFAAGTFGPEVVTRAEVVVPAPPGLSAAALATIPTAFVTAALAFEEAELRPGDAVLVHAGTGGVGQAAIGWARAAGLRVYATASAGKREVLRSLGVAGALDSRSTAFGKEVLAATDGAGVRVVLNSLTGPGFIEAGLSCLAEGGTFVELGKRGIWSAEDMASARPDVVYRPLAVDRLLEEDPSRLGRVLGEVVERVGRGELTPLPHRRWPLAELGSALTEMREARHVGKLVLAPSALSGGPLRGDRSYLVTGGLGGLGLEVARWLAESGAGAIVLNGRRAPDERAEAALGELRAGGAEVRVEIADVTDGEAVERMFSRVDEDLPPLGGVIHSVGVVADAALTNLDWNRFEEVLRPKALGAWHLHQATLDRELDFFVLFSSIVGVIGNAGQANHAAANAFLDQLALHRRALGLAGQAIAWGAWSGVGEAAEAPGRVSGRLTGPGEGWIPPERGLRALHRLVRDDVPASVVTPLDWSALPSPPPWLDELVTSRARRGDARGETPRRLRSLPVPEREATLIRFLQGELAAVLRLRSAPPPETGFFELGMDSLMAVELRNRLNRAFEGDFVVPNTAVFDHPDTVRLARYLARQLGDLPEPAAVQAPPAVRPGRDDRIAIVGMACRFPGGPDLDAFRDLLLAGRDAVTRGRPDGLFVEPEADEARFAGAYVEGMDRFDAAFFRIAPVEAELMDPQQRLLLEVSWSALEDAGLDPAALHGSRTGVYGGVCSHDYETLVAETWGDPASNLYRSTGITASAAMGRVAFALGLTGPTLTVDTACSSSLVAIHQAVTALRLGEADLALAGGVNAILTARTTRIWTDAGMLAADGRCKTFDAAADGFVRGEGCGMVVLKRLSDAEAAGDRILAVILGSGVNQDGASAGLTVPNGPAQERVIEEALTRAGVEPAGVDYLEAHGTGTELGDPVEVAAASAVYGRGRDPERPLLIGSVKTNFGHLEGAAGIAGLIKAVLAMREGVIPKHLHLERPNPRLDWDRLPVRVTAEATPWPEVERPRRAAVSSFGYSGTNAHVVIEGREREGRPPGRHRPPAADETPFAERTHRVLPLSAKTADALRGLAGRYRGWLGSQEPGGEELADMAWTAGTGRSHFPHRAGVEFRDLEELQKGLALVEAGAAREAAPGGKVAFLYTGQGSQWAGMGRDLYECDPAFREVLDRCEEAFREERNESLLAVMFGDAAGLDRTEWTQPALYALECGLTALWAGVEVHPEAVFGHSVGELAAAYAAGALALEDGLRFAARRGALMGSLPEGGVMAAVFAPAGRVAGSLSGSLSLAAENGAHQVVSGPEGEIATLLEDLEAAGIRAQRLATSHAFHSALMDPVLEELEEAASRLPWSSPEVPLVTGLTGRVAEPEELSEGAYWGRQAREPVRFAAAVETLADLGAGVLIEIGPHAVLGPMAALAWPGEASPGRFASIRREGSGDFAAAVARVYEAGVDVSFAGLFAGERRRRVSLPTYPFQRERYWVEPPGRRPSGAGHPLLGTRLDLRRGGTAFGTELRAGDPEWLADHRVFGDVVAPGALYAAQALAAFGELGEGLPAVLTGVQFHRPLVLAEGSRSVQVLLDPEGRFEVASRTAGAEWELHAEGGVGPGGGEVSRVAIDALREGLSPLPAADVYARLTARGIVHGPAFRVLGEVWAGPGTALAEVALPAGLAEPAARTLLLDGCFQALYGASEFGDRDEGAWLPFGWERLWLARPLPERVWCRAEVGEDSEEAREAELAFYSPAGEALGGVRGFTLKRVRRDAVAGSRVDDLLYEVSWRQVSPPGARAADFLGGPAAVASALGPASGYLVAEGLDEDRVEELARELEREAQGAALRGLETLGWEPRPGDRIEAEALRERLQVPEDHRRLFERLLQLLEGAGVLSRETEGGWVVAAPSDDLPPEIAVQPDGTPATIEQALLRRCGGSLAEVLLGRTDPLELLFGDEPGAAELYRDAGALRAAHRLLADAVGAAVRELPDGRRLRVLEVGAGTGATTAAALGALPAERTDYEFTDVSARFFGDAERRFGREGASFRCRTLDIERDPAGQGFDRHGYDVVLAANVLHATRDLAQTLEHCRRLLAPSGLLVLLEGTRPQGWLDLTFGLLPGWWRFADAVRTDAALVGPEVWARVLADGGYGEIAFAGKGLEPAVILARGPAEAEPAAGLFVLAGGDAFGEELTEELRRRRQTAVRGPAGGNREAWRSFFAELPAKVPLRGVAHLAGVREDGSGSPDGEFREELEALGESALALVQGLLDADVRPSSGVWFVTRAGQIVGGEASGAPSGAALWGFAGVVDLEHGEFAPRLVDLDSDGPLPAGVLADEMLFPDREDRVAWRGGKRLAARLVRTGPRPEAREPTAERPRQDRSYLVTGGFGGIGLEVAGWLADAGAGALVLNGRRAPGAAAEAAIAGLRARGMEVRVEIADVTEGPAVEAMFDRIAAALPPLGGVIHSAGAISDASLANQDGASLERVLGPKALGAWNLHRATLDLDLDLFVLFSSVAGVVGNAGQANHAAANAFLDQFARWRRAQGLPGQAIAWGAWSATGEAAEQRARIGNRLTALGWGWLTPKQGLAALSRIVREDMAAATVAAVDWERLERDGRGTRPLLDELRVEREPAGPAEDRDGSVPDGGWAVRLREAGSAEREGLLRALLREEVRSTLRLRSLPPPDAGFFDLGMDSLMALDLRRRLHRALAGVLPGNGESSLPNTVVFDHPDVTRLARHLAARLEAPDARPAAARPLSIRGGEERIAVVGMACRFPGGADLASFWRTLEAGADTVTRGRPEPLPVDPGTAGAPGWGAYLAGLDRFDADFFRIAPVEAELMDPQQRLLLEVSWEALEDAGLDPGGLRGSRTGVYAGIMYNDYEQLLPAGDGGETPDLYRATGNRFSASIGRVAFVLGLEGPAMAVDTACSSSAVAIHQAAAGLQRGESDLALAGGVNAILINEGTELPLSAGMLAPDGRCKTFDAAADGYVRGEGCGMLVLKRLSDAERDGDRIRGVILGSAVNQDGASAGFTVPNGPAQERVIAEALARAGVEPGSVDYLEAHGTGTELGDPIEVRAAAMAYGEGRDADHPLLLGSVKTNVGHLESAAGVAGVIKVLLAMRKGAIPKHLHFERPNPQLDWDSLPVRVTNEATPWPENPDRPVRAGVSSFGFSGTNAHLILEGYRLPQAGETHTAERPHRVLPLSGKTPGALRALAGRYQDWLAASDRDWEALSDAAWTAGMGRSHFAHRAGLVFHDQEELRERLALVERNGGVATPEEPAPPMPARRTEGTDGEFARAVADAYEAGSEVSFAELFPGERRRRIALPTYPFQRERYWAPAPRRRTAPADAEELLYRIEWREAEPGGLRPAAFLAEPADVEVRNFEAFLAAEGMDGTRLAELTAGLNELARSYAREALERDSGVVEEHGRLFARVRELAAGAESSGSPDALAAELGPQYPEGGVELGLLRRCGAALPDVLRGRAEGLDLLFSGTPNAADLYRESPGYRVLNALAGEAVASVVSALPEGRRLQVLEVGAGTGGTTAAVVAALPEGRTDYVFTDVSAGFFGEAEERFGGADAGLSYRVLDIERGPEEQGFAAHRHDLVVAANVLHATRDLGESLAHCRRLLAPSGMLVLLEGVEAHGWLDLTFGMLPGWWRFEDALRTDSALVGPEVWTRALEQAGYGEIALAGKGAGQAVILARGPAEVEPAAGLFVLAEGDAFGDELARELGRRRQTVVRGPAEGDRAAWRSFLASLPAEPPLRGIAYLGALSGGGELMEDVQGTLSSALALTQGLLDTATAPESGVWFVTRGAQVLDGERDGALFGSALWGFGRTADRELADLGVRLLDLELDVEPPMRRLAAELLFPDRETEVLYRDGTRRVPRLVRLPAEVPAAEPRLRGDRSYLVTGGLGGIGLQVAGWLGDRGAGAVVLNGRRVPDSAAEERIAALRARGVAVRVAVADMADAGAVDRMLSEVAAAELPPLGGIFHGAGVLGDAALPNQDRERFEQVLRPKVMGAWNLHRATLDLDLDLFVLFSSLTGVLGNPGQANHAAANAFVDQLALWRRGQGLPALAIQWGAWSGVGEAEEQRGRIAEQLSALGAGWLSPEQGLAALDRLVGGPEASVAAAPVDWSVLAGSGLPPLLEELAPRGREGGAADGDLSSRLREMPGAEREAALLAMVREETRAVLRRGSLPAAKAGFFELGMDSLMAVELRNRLNGALSEGGATVLPSTGVLDYPSPAKLAQHLAARFDATGVVSPAPARRLPIQRGEERIAVVGMGCRFPGGADPASFWRALEAGTDAVTHGRPEPLPVDPETAEDPAWGAYVAGLDRFDADFFRIAPVEAELMDPQQRLLLEVSWEALEDAGLAPAGLAGSRTGVYAGITTSDYRDLIGFDGRSRSEKGAEGLFAATGLSFSTAIGRVAFALGLEGPAIAVDTACSSSLVAIHQAAAGLQRGEADLALAGGVNAILTARVTRLFESGGMLAPDGRCKTFDAAADGYVRGEGCGMLVLKRLSDAERDGERILGVLLGSAVNQDGASAGLTVPNGPAQERVIREALERAGLAPGDVDYLEAHGTGTELGDPVEVQAAAAAYGEGRDADHPLLLGSVKTNVGHLESAAGVAGLIKVLLAMREGVIPRHLHFDRPNPRLDWDSLPVRVTHEATPWPENLDRPLRAGVSSFGFSGTNAHLIVEEWKQEQEHRQERRPSGRHRPPQERRSSDRHRPPAADETPLAERRHRVFPLSGKTSEALRALARRYRDWLTESDRDWEALSDAAWTAGTGRSHFGWRAGLVFQDAAELREGLELVERDGGVAPPEEPAPPMPARRAEAPDGEFARAVADAYEAGSEVSFAELFPGERRRRIALPTYPFRRERHWVSAPRRRPATAHALLGERRELPSGEISFEIETAHLHWLEDHRVFGRVAAPAAFYGAAGLAAAAAAEPRPRTRFVEALRIERPLVLTGDGSGRADGRTVQMVLGSHGSDGGRPFDVFSRTEGESAWTRHAAGRVRSGARAGAAGLSAAARKALKADLAPVDPAALYRRLEAIGLRFGPRFQGLHRLWSAGGRAFGEVVLPAGLDAAGLEAHPAFLDACFHVAAGAALDEGGETARMPAGWDELWLAGPLPERIFCLARGAEEASGERLRIDFALHAPDGEALGGIRGFTLAPVSRSAFRSADEGIQKLLYDVEWREAAEPGLSPADFFPGPETVAAAAPDPEELLRAEGLDAAGPQALAADLEALAHHYARTALAELGLDRRAARTPPEALRRELRVVEQHRRLFERLLGMARESSETAEETPEPRAGEAVELALLRRCGPALSEVLRGRVDGLDLLLSGTPNAADLYRESPRYRALNRLAAEAVGALVATVPEGRRLQVLEVGAGTGATTAAVLPALPEGRTDTVFTDVSAGFFEGAEERFGDSEAGLEYRVLDIERDPEEQGFAAHRYDLVVAANVLHATRDLGESLAHCRKLLAPSGVLVLVEAVESLEWLDLTFGLVEGWWRFEDGYRADHALIAPREWRRALSDSGYEEVGVLGDRPGAQLGAAVVLARGPAEVRAEPGAWVVWPGGGERGLGAQLAGALDGHGQTVAVPEVSGAADDREWWQEVFAELPAEPPLQGVVHLGAVSGSGELLDDVRGALSSALALTQGLRDAGAAPEAGVWFVTRGGQVLGREREGQLSGSILWGFGRTAARELGDLPVRLVDVEPGVEEPVGRLVKELLFPDRESEVLYRGGVRRTPRLVRLPRGTAPEGGNWRSAPDPGRSFDRLPVERVAEHGGRVRGDRSYLVTGGLGGVGLRVGEWLGEQGAGGVVLNGRREPEGMAAEAVARLESAGAPVRVVVADVADGASVARMLKEIGSSGLPPLGGVIHAAGVLSDRALLNQDWRSFERVLGPKVFGAWNLHRATLDLDLDLFVLFSAFGGLLGNPGQANHAAANAFLDQLARWRRSVGLSGQAIQWGAWSEVGEAEEQRDRITRAGAAQGVGWLTPEQGLAALTHLVSRDAATAAVAPLEPSVLFSGERRPPLFAALVADHGGPGAEPPEDLAFRLRGASGPEREAHLLDFVREEARSVLRLRSLPPAGTPFFELGMDSLMAIELRHRLRRGLAGADAGGDVISDTVVFDYPDAGQLARYLSGRLAPAPPAPAEDARGAEEISMDDLAAMLFEAEGGGA